MEQSRQDEKTFAASQTVDAPAGYTGPLSCKYTSLSGTAGQTIPKGQECEPDNDALDCLQRAVDGSVCAGMAHAIVAHEQFHWNTCHRLSDPVYWNRSGADIAAEEAQAYDAQAKILGEELKNAQRRAKRKQGFWSYGILGRGGYTDCAEIGRDR